jgi:hypothetical protein
MKTFIIRLSKLKTPRDICHIMEKRGVKNYTYTFRTKDEIIKEGKANDKEWKTGTWGNRIYRQAGGILGWGPNMLFDSSAIKMKYLMDIYFPYVTKNDVIIVIRDFTRDLIGMNENDVNQILLNDEDKRVQTYTRTYGGPPSLNIQKTRSKPRPIVDLFS